MIVDLSESNSVPNALLQLVIANMRKDPVFDVVIGDDLLISYGNALAEEHAAQPSMNKSISYSLRALAQLFLQMKESIPSLHTVTDIFHPDNWRCMVKAIKDCGGWDEETRTYKKPTAALNVGNILALCVKFLPAYYVLQ